MPAQTWIRASLKERGFKLKDAAETLGITPPRMTDILKGMREVQADEVLPLSTLLGMSSKSLLKSLAEGEKCEAEPDGFTLPVLGHLSGTGVITPLAEDADITSVPTPPDAKTNDGLFCYRMGDDSLEKEIRQGSLLIAGDPRTHYAPVAPGAIVLIEPGDGKVAARQFFRGETGEDWLVPLPTNHNPTYESWRFSMLPAELDLANTASGKPSSTEHQKVFRMDDIKAVVMWVHRRYMPQE